MYHQISKSARGKSTFWFSLPAFRSLSSIARGILFYLLAVDLDQSPVPAVADIQRDLGLSPDVCRSALAELQDAGMIVYRGGEIFPV